MGCDIHFNVERRESGRWLYVPAKEQGISCYYCDGKGKHADGEPCWFCDGSGYGTYANRCYDTFAILADVRNGHGVAGLKTGDRFTPISQPRGLPEDLSAELRAPDADIGDHSFSWLLLDELQKFDWQQRAKKLGVLSAEGFEAWDAGGGGWPKGWCSWVTGNRVRIVSNDEMRSLIKDGAAHLQGNSLEFYTQVEWEDTYAACSGTFYTHVIPALTKLGDPKDVRIVFGFDS